MPFAIAATLIEAVNATGGVNDALFAGVKRMAVRAQIEAHFGHGPVRFDFAAAGQTGDFHLHIIGVNFWFHVGVWTFRAARAFDEAGTPVV